MASKFIVIVDTEGKEFRIEYLMEVPTGQSEDTARAAINTAFNRAKKENADDWSYDDVASLLRAEGYNFVDFGSYDFERDSWK